MPSQVQHLVASRQQVEEHIQAVPEVQAVYYQVQVQPEGDSYFAEADSCFAAVDDNLDLVFHRRLDFGRVVMEEIE